MKPWPEWAQWRAVDADGRCFYYQEMPYLEGKHWMANGMCDVAHHFTESQMLEIDFSKSLTSREAIRRSMG